MTGFSTIDESVTIGPDTGVGKWELKLLPLDQLRTELKPTPGVAITEAQPKTELKKTAEAPKPQGEQAAAAPPPPPPSDDAAQRAADGFLINGSVNNAATSQFSMAQRFGNTASGRSLYQYMLNLRLNNSALDARSYSLAGFDSPKPNTSQITGGFSIQGPLKIPHLLHHGPNIFLNYQRTQNSTAVTTSGLMPTQAQRNGDFSNATDEQGRPVQLYNPVTGLPYLNNQVPISPQAAALLNLLPLPNFAGNAQYNYQIPLVTDTHSDAINSNASKTIGRFNQLSGSFALTDTRGSGANLFHFVDKTDLLGIHTTVNWSHTFNAHLRANIGYDFSRQSSRMTPYWENRANVSGLAGITGNNQDPENWGPPTLGFTSALTPLSDAQSSFVRNMTNSINPVVTWNRSPHNVTIGLIYRRQQFNYLQQANPRGTFTFTGAATAGAVTGGGIDFADFLIGLPAASSIAFANADKYLRGSVYAAYAQDDWRVGPQLTVNVGVRWDYQAPVTETKDRLVNLDVASGYSAVAPVQASNPTGSLTKQNYPSSLMRSDWTAFQPRIGVSWRPIAGSSMLVSAGYGINYDTSVYPGIALQMAGQPFAQSSTAKSFSVQSSKACPLTLANGFYNCSPTTTSQVFGVDPDYRIGYVHTWSLKVQRDLPGSLQMVATYLGTKGMRGAQLFLPNTNPAGATNPCPSCPIGFEYLTSTGSLTRNAGTIQLRRRLHSGFTATATYTYSKSLDDYSAIGGQGAATSGSATLAQDWRNLSGERGLSVIDQRHLLSATAQYTTGMGLAGGSLLSGWRARAYKEWTIQTQITTGSGTPETPIDASIVVPGGYSSLVRPNVTGAPTTVGGRPNPAAYIAPALGQWGNARRNSITGPMQFTMNAAMNRTFRLDQRFNLDVQFAANNVLNHVAFSNWYTNINSTQFGLPAAANTMRVIQGSARLRF
jgi:hypothetical protein